MVFLNIFNRITCLAAYLVAVAPAALCAAGPFMTTSHTFIFNKAVTESGGANVQGSSLVIEPDSRVRFNYGKAYGLRNGSLKAVFTPPDMKKSGIPVLAQRAECVCAFKVHIGRVVVELSERGVQVFLQDKSHSRIDTVYAEKRIDMTPAGLQTILEISIEDRVCKIAVNSDTILSCVIDEFDFSLVHLATFGQVFTVHEFSLHPLVRRAIVADPSTASIVLDAIYYPSRFNSPLGLKEHHFITWKGGKASMQALLETSAPDAAVHDALVAAGIRPGNNLTADSWKKRQDAASREPDKRADGDSLILSILYGDREFSAHEVLADLKGNEYDFRFAGNRALIPVWKSGCVACLQSCPGSKIANRTYTMRDLEKKKVSFRPVTNLPFKDGDPVRIRIKPVRQ